VRAQKAAALRQSSKLNCRGIRSSFKQGHEHRELLKRGEAYLNKVVHKYSTLSRGHSQRGRIDDSCTHTHTAMESMLKEVPLTLFDGPQYFDRNNDHIEKFQARANPEPLPETSPTLAHDTVAAEKFVRLSLNEDLDVRREGVSALVKYLNVTQENVMRGLRANVVDAIVTLAQDSQSEIRWSALKAAEQLARVHAARATLVSKGLLPHLLSLLSDPVDAVRTASYKVVVLLVTDPIQGRKTVVEYKVVERILECMNDRPSQSGLVTLYEAIQGNDGRKNAIDADGIEVMKKCSDSDKPLIRELALKCLAWLCVPQEGKTKALGSKTMDVLSKKLEDEIEEVRIQAASAIMNLTNCKEGKVQALELPAHSLLVDLVAKGSTIAKLFAMKAIGNMAELDRAAFEHALVYLEDLGHSDNEVGKKA